MLLAALADKQLQARRILFDSWYASCDNLKLVYRAGWIFSTTLKANRLVSLSKEEGYIHLDEIDWTPERLEQGVLVRLQKVPFDVRLIVCNAIQDAICMWSATAARSHGMVLSAQEYSPRVAH